MAKGIKTGGRTKGTPNKKTAQVADRLAELNCDPLEAMVTVANQAMAAGDLALAGAMFKELAQYIYPKRKAIDMSMNTGADDNSIIINYVPNPED